MKPIRALAERRNGYSMLSRRVPLYRIVLRLILLLAGVGTLAACGNSSNSSSSETVGPLSGNWQFQLTTDGSFASVASPICPAPQGSASALLCLGGFLVQSKAEVTGQVQYSITLPSQPGMYCNSGSATVTGTLNGQNVTVTALAGPEKFVLTGTLSTDGSTMTGTYTSSGGSCGKAQTGAAWTATSVPPLSGAIQGSFHSTGSGSVTALVNQEFPVTGVLTQGSNNGASSVSVTGTLNFQGYPCLAEASVNGQISGNSVILQIIAPNGLTVGQIGGVPGTSLPNQASPVVFNRTSGGNVLRGSNGYALSTSGCKGGNVSGDIGNICLGVGTTKACSQPISLSPAFLTFPSQLLGSATTSQKLTLTNTDPSGTAQRLQLIFPGSSSTPSDFDGTPHFSEQDSCATSPDSPFTLSSQKSCTITVFFSPQESCPWLPIASIGGAAPSVCPPFLPALVGSPPGLTASLKVTCLTCNATMDNDTNFTAPVLGVGASAIQPSTPELDFGAEKAAEMNGAGGETSLPQSVSFTNQGASSVLILPAVSPVCGARPGVSAVELPRPATAGTIPGFQVVTGGISLINNPPAPNTVQYTCDVDLSSNKPSFQITSDNCSGAVLAPQQSCTLAIMYAPQPTAVVGGLDYFLELNTLECTSRATTNCEIDSGRFPVELKSNVASSLRMFPGAGLDFGPLPRNQTSPPLTITLQNDALIASPTTVNFTGSVVKGDYAETDDCGFSLTLGGGLPTSTSLAPGSSCTLSFTFTPKVLGFDPGSMTITFDGGLTPTPQTQTIFLRGFGQ